MIPRTGSLGLTRDTWALCHAACYEPHPTLGHQWKPPQEIAERMSWTDEGYAAGFLRDPELCDDPIDTVPFDPKCTNCRRAAKRVLTGRGLTSEQMQRAFAAVGARWDWTTAQKAQERRESDHGTALVDPEGPGVILDSTLRARQRRREARIVHSDRKAESKAR